MGFGGVERERQRGRQTEIKASAREVRKGKCTNGGKRMCKRRERDKPHCSFGTEVTGMKHAESGSRTQNSSGIKATDTSPCPPPSRGRGGRGDSSMAAGEEEEEEGGGERTAVLSLCACLNTLVGQMMRMIVDRSFSLGLFCFSSRAPPPPPPPSSPSFSS